MEASSAPFSKLLTDYYEWARYMSADESSWPLKLLIILLGYASIIVPAIILVFYVKRGVAHGSLDGRGCFTRFLRQFAVGRPDDAYELVDSGGGRKTSSFRDGSEHFMKDFSTLVFYFLGIQATLVLMGFLQEKIMTTGYKPYDDPSKMNKFGDAQFLVFCNRVIALILSLMVLFSSRAKQPPHVPPLYVHSYTSFSNTMSSWCQYEALKYVSFPAQTICKVSKVVATMLMGRIVRGQRYSFYEYGSGIGIAAGASLFLLSSHGDNIGGSGTATTISGMVLMVGYLMFDAFTVNWQKALFDTKPKVSKYQMMLGVNAFSAVLCLVSLAEQGTLSTSFSFILSNQGFFADVLLLSVSGAIGQLFIYSTIERFGPIVFAVFMTIRQMLSIVLSSLYYGHAMSVFAILGFCIVFLSIFIDIYRRYFEKQRSTDQMTLTKRKITDQKTII